MSAATTDKNNWYIVKIADRTCEIIDRAQFEAAERELTEHWGPFADRTEALAKRVGLIRAGKCQPV